MYGDPPLPGMPPAPPPPPPPLEHQWEPTIGAGPPETAIHGLRCKACEHWVRGQTPPEDVRACPGAFTIHVSFDADYDFAVTDVWPDGDWPDDITEEAARETIEEHFQDFDFDLLGLVSRQTMHVDVSKPRRVAS